MSTNFLRLYKFLFRPSTFQVREVRDKQEDCEEVFGKAVVENDVGGNVAPTDVVGLSDPISLTYWKMVKKLWKLKCQDFPPSVEYQVQFHPWKQ